MLTRLNIGPRLIAAFGLVALLNLIGMGIIWRDMDVSSADFKHITGELLEHERLANEWAALSRENGVRMVIILSSKDPQQEAFFAPSFKATSERIGEIQKQLESDLKTPERKAYADDIDSKRSTYVAKRKALTAERESTQQPIAIARLESELLPVRDGYAGALEKYARSFRDDMNRASAALEARNALSTRLLAVLALLSVIVSLSFAWRITRSITTPLGVALDAARTVASGRLDRPVPTGGHDEAGQLLQAIDTMQNSLRGLIGEIRNNTGDLHAAAEALSATTTQIVASSSHQSEAAASMAASVEELTASIGSIADNAESAHAITVDASSAAENGANVINDTVVGMNRIADNVHALSGSIQALGQDSDQIAAIVGVIREIADQTNLLALNAAIEAARAGESGRGFAVVADEVRKLAERTTSSTGEIHNTIEKIRSNTLDAVTKMESGIAEASQGVVLARQAGNSMTEIGNGSRTVVTAISDISAALHEQNSVSNLLASNVEKVADSAEANTAAIRAAAAEAQRLTALATSLEQAVQRFVL